MNIEKLREEFGVFLQENNCGKNFGDENFMDIYGSCGFIEDWWINKILEREKELNSKMKNFKIANGNYNCGEEGCCSKNPNDVREEWEIEEQASYNMAIDDCQSLLALDEK